jgi:alkyl hydroperoxide reductase subunit AhpC
MKPEFDKRKVKPIGLSIDPVESHKGWTEDIKETQGTAVNFPIVADPQQDVRSARGDVLDAQRLVHEAARTHDLPARV